MVLYGDYHTHTTYSDAKQSIMESAIVAQNKGLKQIAITDHGFNKLGGVKRKDIEKMRQECNDAKQKTGVDVLLGIEANIISKEGDVDLTKQDLDNFDIIIVGFHQIVKAKTVMDRLGFVIPNNLGIKTKKRIQQNTNALIRAIEKYPVDIISHPGVGFPIDMQKVAEVAKKHGTKMEINGKRIAYNKNDIKNLLKLGVEFIINSDAHSKNRVGSPNKAINFIIKNKIPLENICNYGKKPNFRSTKGE